MTRDELQGVLAHEMSHVRNYDIRLMMMMSVLIGTIALLADVFWQMSCVSAAAVAAARAAAAARAGARRRRIILVIFIVAIVLAILAPLLAEIIQLAVSRQREYLADASAVELTRNPLGLTALRKIDADPHDLRTANRGTAHLFIANPIKKFELRADSRVRQPSADSGSHPETGSCWCGEWPSERLSAKS